MENKSKNGTKWVGIMASLLIVFAIIILFIVFLLNGKVTTSGNYSSDNSSQASLNCEINNLKYPFFTYENDNDNSYTVVNAIFSDGIQSISLLHKIEYKDTLSSSASEAVNHAAMNKSFGNNLGADAFNAKYTISDNFMSMSLYANKSDLSEMAKKYFLIQENVTNIDGYKRNYENQGFICKQKDVENNNSKGDK